MLYREGLEKTIEVLIIEDNGDQALILSEFLRRAARTRSLDIRVTVHTRPEALFTWLDNHPLVMPAVAFIDIQMPRMDGLQFREVLQEHRQTKNTRYIAYTANVLPSDQERYLNAGFHGLIGKPFDIATIDGLLLTILTTEQAVWADNR